MHYIKKTYQEYMALNNMSKSPIIAIDFGVKKIGIAISTETQTMALPIAVVINDLNALKNINEIYQKYKCKGIVIGYPLDLSGNKTESSILVEKFANNLHEYFKVDIMLFDERFTSKAANNMLKTMNYSRRDRNNIDDKVAASVLLQDFLDQLLPS